MSEQRATYQNLCKKSTYIFNEKYVDTQKYFDEIRIKVLQYELGEELLLQLVIKYGGNKRTYLRCTIFSSNLNCE